MGAYAAALDREEPATAVYRQLIEHFARATTPARSAPVDAVRLAVPSLLRIDDFRGREEILRVVRLDDYGT